MTLAVPAIPAACISMFAGGQAGDPPCGHPNPGVWLTRSQARLKAGMTQREFAERAGVPVTMISAYERDKRQPTLATLFRLLRAAGFDLRLQLAAYDPHDEVLARLEASRSDSERNHRDHQLQQAPVPATRDIDFTPDTSQENLGRLSQALTELGARIRTEAVPAGLPFSDDAASLAGAEVWNLVCAEGEFDLSFHPSGFAGGYAQLAVNAHRLRVGDVEVVVADLADVIQSKESAGRPKDVRVLPLLYRQLAARRAQRSAEPG